MSHYKTIQALGTPIVLHSGITAMLGSMTASALLSHIMYWSERTDNPLGFYRTLDELKLETSLSDNELRTARKLLVNLELVTETHKRLEHRLYFKFNEEKFDKLFGEFLNSQVAKCENHISPPVNFTTGEMLNPQLGSCENHISLYTKITTKNTTEITSKSEGKNAPTHASENSDCGFSDDEILAVANNHIEQNSKSLEFNPLDFLLGNGIDEKLAKDFVSYKKSKLKKGEKITQQMLVLVKNQAEKTGKISFADALKIMIASGKWQGFNADWNWQPLFEAVLLTENRQIPDWLVNPTQNTPVAQITTTPKLDPTQAILCNGLLKPLFPNMNQAQSWQFVNQNRQPYEMLDETHDRLMNDIDWQNFDYSKMEV